MNQKIYDKIGAWPSRPIKREQPRALGRALLLLARRAPR